MSVEDEIINIRNHMTDVNRDLDDLQKAFEEELKAAKEAGEADGREDGYEVGYAEAKEEFEVE